LEQNGGESLSSNASATLTRPIVGVLAAIGITTAMDASGLSVFSALPLLPLAGLLWAWQRFPRVEMGLAWGSARAYGLALLHPLVVIGAVTAVAALAGVIDLAQADWRKAGLNLVLVGVSTILVVILTEEGFFRGWLWASLRRAGLGETPVLLWTSVAFSLWHVSAVSLETGFDIPAPQIPVYLVNAVLMGAIWGMLRLLSGSVVVASVSHGVWNGLAYVLFGFGTRVGALGIEATHIYGPEVGAVGLILNALFAFALWRWLQSHRSRTHGEASA
jgi:membrane protease YdiL (CAAX protease family)